MLAMNLNSSWNCFGSRRYDKIINEMRNKTYQDQVTPEGDRMRKNFSIILIFFFEYLFLHILLYLSLFFFDHLFHNFHFLAGIG